MDAEDRALAALEREAAAADPQWASGGGGDDEFDDDFAREEARVRALLAKHQVGAADHDNLDDLEAEGGGGDINDDDVLGELADLEGQVHRERAENGGGDAADGDSSVHHADDLDEDRLLAEAEAEAERLAMEEEQEQKQPAAATAATPANQKPPPKVQPVAAPAPVRPPRPSQQLTSATSALSAPEPVAPVAANTAAESLASLETRLLSLKQKAVEHNRAGRKAEALETMRHCKALQARVEEARTRAAATDATAATPAIAAAPAPPVRPKPTAAVTAIAAVRASVPAATSGGKLTIRAQLEYDTLLAQLDAQIVSLGASMKTLVSEGGGGVVKAGSKEAKMLALQYFRAKTRSTKDRDVLLLARQRNLPPPATHTEEIEMQQELSFPAMNDTTLEVVIACGRDLHNSRIVSAPKDLAPSVQIALDYAIDLDGNTKVGPSQSTPSLKGPEPAWSQTLRLSLPFVPRQGEKPDRAAVKKLLRSRVTFTLLHKRFLLGLTEVARGDVRLKEFGSKAEVVTQVKLKEATTGARCGELDVTLRLRRPFEGIDLRSVKQTVLVVDEFEDVPTVEVQPVIPPAPTPSHSAPPPAVTSTTNLAPAPCDNLLQPPATIPRASSSDDVSGIASPAAASDIVDGVDLSSPHAIAKFHSNDLLEFEIERSQSQLAHVRARIANGAREVDEEGVDLLAAQVDELEDRITALKVALEVLVTRVQNGKLSLTDYLAQIRVDIAQESRLALALSRAQRKPDAARVVERVKIMKAELANAEENQEELEKC